MSGSWTEGEGEGEGEGGNEQGSSTGARKGKAVVDGESKTAGLLSPSWTDHPSLPFLPVGNSTLTGFACESSSR